jgi:peptidyl-prolyl cis-trans isomerase C
MVFMKFCTLLAVFAAALSAQPPNLAITPPRPPATPPVANPDEVVMTVGERKITAADYTLLVKTLLPPQSQELGFGPGRRQFAQKLAELMILADEGAKRDLDKQPDIALKLDFQRNNGLAAAMYQQLEKSTVVSDADIQAYYDAHKADYEVLNARHILLRVKGSPTPNPPGKPELTEDEAKAKAEAIRKRLAGGEDFAKVASEESYDAAEKGGNLGVVKHGTNVMSFEQAAFALKPGEISQPVKTPFGYEIIQVQSRATQSLADVKQDVISHVKPTLAPKAVEDLLNKTKFNISDAFFGPAPPSGTGTGR